MITQITPSLSQRRLQFSSKKDGIVNFSTGSSYKDALIMGELLTDSAKGENGKKNKYRWHPGNLFEIKTNFEYEKDKASLSNNIQIKVHESLYPSLVQTIRVIAQEKHCNIIRKDFEE